MNKLVILAAALPVLCTGAGFGAGIFLAPSPETAQAEAAHGETAKEPAHEAILAGAEAAHSGPAEDDHGSADGHGTEAHDDPAAHKPSGHKADGHDTAAHDAHPVKTQDGAHQLVAASAEGMSKPAEFKRSSDVVKLGQITVPVYKPMSVTYVVADLGIAMPDTKTAAHYRVAENAVHLRDTIVASFRKAAENPKMKRATLDSDWLSKTLTDDLRAEVKDRKKWKSSTDKEEQVIIRY